MALLLLTAAPLTAATVMTTVSFTPGLSIPDNNPVGVADFRDISSTIASIQEIRVTLTIEGGFAGDYYAYLEHNGRISVLLNRIGVTAGDTLGSSASGLSLTFTDNAAAGDVHSATRGTPGDPVPTPLSGLWQPDAREANPATVLDTMPRTAFLSNFEGMEASGTWTLFVADRSSGSFGSFSSWTMEITGTVPEPATPILLLPVVWGMCTARRRHRLAPAI